MAEVGGLLVNLGLDVAQIKQDVGKANRELSGFRNQVNRQMGKMQRSVNKLTGGFRGLIAVIGGAALVRSINNAARSLEEINRQANSLGAQRSTIQELVFTFRQFGLQQDDVSDALGTLSDRAQDAKDGMKSFQEDFALVNIEVADLKNKRPGELFDLFARKIAEVDDPTRRTAAAVRIFGDDLGRRLLPLLQQGAEGLEKYAKQAREAGAVVSDELVKDGAEAAKTFRALREVITAQFARVVANNAEELSNVATALTDIVTGASKAGAAIVNFAESMGETVARLQGFTGGAADMRDRVADLNAQIEKIREQGTKTARGAANEAQLNNLLAERARLMDKIIKINQATTPREAGAGGASRVARMNAGLGALVEPSPDEEDGGGAGFSGRRTTAIRLRHSRGQAMAYTEALKQINAQSKQTREVGTTTWREIGDEVRQTNRMADQLGFTFSSAFEEAIIKGNDLRGVLRGLAEDIQRIFLRQTVTKPLGNQLASAFAGAFTGGGGMMSDPTPGTAGRAAGGPVSGGQSYIVGERGPELFTPRNSGQITPNDRLGGGLSIGNINLYGVGNADDVRRAIPELVGAIQRVDRSVEGRAVRAVSETRMRS